MLTHRLIHRPTLPQRITAILQAEPSHTLHYQTLADRLHLRGRPHHVRNTLARMAKEGRVVWVAYGTYRLAEEARHAS